MPRALKTAMRKRDRKLIMQVLLVAPRSYLFSPFLCLFETVTLDKAWLEGVCYS